jgi:hypothetical protein
MIEVLKPLIRQFMPFAQEKMGFSRPPRLFLRKDEQNAANPMGKTGFYDPQNESITLYITGRHPKDIMRSLAHELQHHTQKCNGQFENVQNMGEEGYAQNNSHMRSMEIEAYQASIVFRDWEDSCKGTIYYEHLQKGDKSSMSTKNWKNGELKSLLSESWGFKMDLSKLNESQNPMDPDYRDPEEEQEKIDKRRGRGHRTKENPRGANPVSAYAEHQEVMNEEGEPIFAPNHYCVHHGGVQHNGSIEMAEAVKHNYNEKLGRVTHYDMKLADGTILENVAAEDIQITDASLAEGHGGKPGKRDDRDDDEKEELDEMGCPHDDDGGHEMVVQMDGPDDGEEMAVTDMDDAEGMASELLSLAQRIADALGGGDAMEMQGEEPDLEERRSRGRKGRHIRGKEGENNLRPEGKELSEAQVRALVRKALQKTAKTKGK